MSGSTASESAPPEPHPKTELRPRPEAARPDLLRPYGTAFTDARLAEIGYLMSADLPLTTHELATIRARAEAVADQRPPDPRMVAQVVVGDVPRMVAEIERLRAQVERLGVERDDWHVTARNEKDRAERAEDRLQTGSPYA